MTSPHLTDVTLLRTALDCAPGGLILLQTLPGADSDFQIVLCNQAAERLIGQLEVSLVGKSARETLGHLVPARLWPVAAQATTTGESHHEPLWITLPDLTRRRYDLTFCPHPNGVAVSFQDITAAEQQKALLENVIEHSMSGIVVEKALRDPSGEVTDFQAVLINPKALEFGRHTREEALSRSIRQLNPQFEPSGLLEAYRHVLATGRPFRVDFFHAPIGRWLELTASRIDDGQLVALFNDTTEQRQAAIELERQKTLLDGVLNTSPNGVAVYEAVHDALGDLVDFRLLLANNVTARLAGRTTADMQGKTVTELYPATQSLGIWHVYAETHRTGVSRRVEHHYADADRWFDFSVSKLGDYLVVTFSETTDRKRTELKIQAQNDLLNGVMNASLNGITVWEAVRDEAGAIGDFRLAAINENAVAMSPLPREHVERSKTLLEMYPSSKTVGTFDRQVAVVETGVPFRSEVPSPDGTRWYDLAVTKLNDGTVVTYNEITDRKRIEIKLQEQARLFDGVMNSLMSGLSVLEVLRDESGQLADLRYLAVSQAVVNDTGLRRDQLVNATMRGHFPSVRQTAYWTAYQAALDTGQPQYFEIHYTGEGLDNWLTNAVYKLDENRLISTYTIVNDQKRALRQVEEQAAMLRSVLDATLIPVVLFEAIRDQNGAIIDYRYLAQNETNARLVGLSQHEMADRTMLDVLPGLKEGGIFDRYVAVTETGQPARFELPLHDQNLHAWLDFQVVKHGDGIVVSAIDQTQLRQALADSERLVEELRRSNADLEQFAYVASHDLQEPLRKIQSFGERIDKKYAESLGPDGRQYLDRMRDASARMSLLINNLLSFSRLTRRSEVLRPTDLAQVVQATLNDLEVRIQETGARVTVGDLPTVAAVPAQMQQLFQNLLGNALKFVRPGVPPDIRLAAGPVSADERAAHRLDGFRRYVKITLTDNGIGFEPEYAERVFVIFQRLHGRADYEGTGIGLAICKKIVENHQGHIWAESQPGEGTTFSVILPEK